VSQKGSALVIGGGIHGASFACLLAAAGHEVVLSEQADFVSGASSNSMKTIHGGIRFIDRLKLVQAVESIRASAELGRLFPDLVRPLSFVIPNRSLLQNRLTAGVAAGLFNTLVHLFAGGPHRPTTRATVVPLADYGEHYARFSTRLGKTAFQWCDLQVVESELLVLRMLQAAVRRGARIENYLGVVGIEPQGDAYSVTFECSRAGHQNTERFTDVFDCSGAGRAAEQALGALDPTVDFVRAVNLVVPGSYSKIGVGMRSSRFGHYLFSVPWKQSTIFGTWYFDSPPDAAETDLVGDCLTDLGQNLRRAIGRDEVKLVHLGELPALRSTRTIPVHKRLLTRSVCRTLHQNSPDSRTFLVRGTKYTTALCFARRSLRRAYEGAKDRFSADGLFDGLADRVSPRDLARETKAQSLLDFVRRRSASGGEGTPGEDVIRDAASIMSELRCWSEEERARQIVQLRACYAAVQQQGVAHGPQAQSDQRPRPNT
jgi:glycerol-3-phosphate dehydrogenase